MAISKALAEALAEVLIAEAAEMGANDLRSWLSDALHDCCEPGEWCYLHDFIGDFTSGDVICCCNGDMKRCPYEITAVNGKMTAVIDMEKAVDVLPRTVYEEEADEEDHYASMESGKLYTKGAVPICERFISKKERDGAASDSFAGKGKSFPILKPSDVMAAVRSMGRAGTGNYDAGTLKRNIIRIAKAKGWTSSLPKAWQKGAEEEKQESDKPKGAGDVLLVESAVHLLDPIKLTEARSDYEVKLIAPGKGASAFYPAPVLERDGPKVFRAGTHMYWNHATEAESDARPEGDLNNLAAVLTTDAFWRESGREGPGLYARAKVFSDFASKVEEKASHIGLSIRGAGNVVKERGKPKMVEGLPELSELTYADSVDFVTKAGAGGMVLVEAAKPEEFCMQCGARKAGDCQKCIQEAARAAESKEQEESMTAEETKQLQEDLKQTRAELRKVRERQALNDASVAIASYYKTVRVNEGVQQRVTGRVLAGNIPLTEAGDLDHKKLTEFVEAETKDELEYLSRVSGGRIVAGMGSVAPPSQPTKEEQAAQHKAVEAELERSASLYGFGGKEHSVGRRILNEGASAFDFTYNARNDGATVRAGTGSLPLEA